MMKLIERMKSIIKTEGWIVWWNKILTPVAYFFIVACAFYAVYYFYKFIDSFTFE